MTEQVGLDFFGVGEHHRHIMPISSPSSLINAAAAVTTRIGLGSTVTVLSTDDPVRVYQQHATAAALAPGRVEITAGRGSGTDSYPLYGYLAEGPRLAVCGQARPAAGGQRGRGCAERDRTTRWETPITTSTCVAPDSFFPDGLHNTSPNNNRGMIITTTLGDRQDPRNSRRSRRRAFPSLQLAAVYRTPSGPRKVRGPARPALPKHSRGGRSPTPEPHPSWS